MNCLYHSNHGLTLFVVTGEISAIAGREDDGHLDVAPIILMIDNVEEDFSPPLISNHQ